MHELIERARRYAIEAHKRIDHRRKYSKQPYDAHLKSVADLVATVADDPVMIAAAWLHDTVEDTPATFGDIEREFGPDVARLVSELTDVSKPGDGNRAVRKAIDREHTAQASPEAKTVKLADLIDNCSDICRHDPRFAKIYLAEMRALLKVLEDGDSILRSRAQREVERCTQRLGLESVPEALHAEMQGSPILTRTPRRSLRLFVKAFTAADIAEPLRSFDSDTDARVVSETLHESGLSIAGVRRQGRVKGFVHAEWLTAGPCGEQVRPFGVGQILSSDASLSEVIHALTRYDQCFVDTIGGVDGMLTRADVQKPVARMWLFGMVTMLEMELAGRLRAQWPDDTWTGLVSEGRRKKAEALLEERLRRGQICDLVDCLQLSDKASILMRDDALLAEYGFASRSTAKQVAKDLESLRNNLAHGQDIVTYDWAQIARIAKHIESEVAASG